MRSVLGYPASGCSTLLFLSVLIVAFFPNIFIGILKLPFGGRTNPPSESNNETPSSPRTSNPSSNMSWFQKTIQLPARSRGSYLITDTIISELPELKQYKVGLLTLFVQHTSCALSMNENWDEDVRADMSDALDRIVPEGQKGGPISS